MKTPLFLAGLVLTLATCQRESAEPQALAEVRVCPAGNTATTPAEGYRLLPGTWTWAQDEWVRRGSGTTLDTPTSTGKQIRFVFNTDRSYQYLVNGTATEAGTYALRQAGTDPILVLDLAPQGQTASGGVLLTLCENGLVLLGGANDAGPNRSFVRGR